MTLDVKDWKILATLSKNCRISLTQIAKVVRVSREVADYRVKKLIKTGVIKSFCVDVDLHVLGYTKHVIYLELKNVDKEKEETIFTFLKNHTFISWIVTSTGKWSVIFDLHAKSTQHLSQLIKELKQEFGIYFGEHEIVTLEHYHYFHSKFFTKKEIFKEKKQEERDPREGNPKEGNLDAIDLSLLRILRNNARADYVMLSRKVRLTPEAISKRIKRLKKYGIIRQCYIFPDLTKLGFQHYNIQITLENIRNDKEISIIHYLENHPSVSYIYKPISLWDIEFGVFVKTPGELRDFMLQLRTRYPEHIRVKDVALFYEELLPNYLPEGVF
ncbi:Lrp/AsnC family transcriptional regulator [Candidatus Woesearchaeota archaeon]|nr:Lrp/AsnC family transcriptional regulator [Candidatus Woesearchaeota archaeon]